MASVRRELKLSQARAAAILEIAERSYKNYETEIRELPLSVALRFCEHFNQDLIWLIEGERRAASEKDIDLVGDTIEAVFAESKNREIDLTSPKAGKIGRFVYNNCFQKGTEPKDEVALIFDLLIE
ncbi:helix-turn-helix domain-containing protein [Novosphingobium sp. KA1]|uniref:helix-turn-helix domain-containing protein n=1 Tax=Novosphingobium sp. (strain KA1) TaxID=164608 RepID=UPI001A8F9C9F|nr:helix-turn-helix transcriptional regulator [Novosphingobium sp. KA1]QSR19000.1 XRE family transcriptional regulator [Novosphingobium sp. KA1]